MRLLELTRAYFPSVGGLEKSISDKVRIYKALGIDFKIVSTDFYSKLNDSPRDPDVIYLKQYTPYNITPAIRRHLEKNYDIINVNMIGRFFSDFAILNYASTKTKIVLTPHSFYHTRNYYIIKIFLEMWLFPALLKKIDAMVVFTHHEKKEWVKRYHIDERRIFVIPHFIDSTFGSAQEYRNDPDVKEYIVYVGRRENNKQTDLLLRTFSSLKDIQYSLYLTLTDSDIAGDVREAVKKDKRIKLLGFVSDEEKNNLLRNAAGAIFPTSFESFGYTAFEASCHSKPLLCSDIPVFRELLSGNGVLYFENTQNSLGDALIKFGKLSPDEKHNMGGTNKRHLSNYTFDESVKKYATLFQFLSQKGENS